MVDKTSEVIDVFQECLGASAKFDIDSEMDDVKEWDSIHHVTLMTTIEKRFSISIPEEDFFDLTSVRAFVDEVNKLVNE